jgi:hypothetical protein
MDTPRTTQTVGLCALFGLILALVLGIAAVAASMDEIGRSAWAGGIALLVSGGAVVVSAGDSTCSATGLRSSGCHQARQSCGQPGKAAAA